MNLQELKQRYHPEIVERMLEVLHDTIVSKLIDELIYQMPKSDFDKWAKQIQEDNSYSDEVNHG